MDFVDEVFDFDLIKYLNSDDDKLYENIVDFPEDFVPLSPCPDLLEDSLLANHPYIDSSENQVGLPFVKSEVEEGCNDNFWNDTPVVVSKFKNHVASNTSEKKSKRTGKKILKREKDKIVASLASPVKFSFNVNTGTIHNVVTFWYIGTPTQRRLLPRAPREESKLVRRPRPCLLFRARYVSALNQRLAAVYSLPVPLKEQDWSFRGDYVSEEEKSLLPEFFKSPCTVNRYFKIREHILTQWQMTRPKYLCKTAVRQGLQNCGDVHLISRVHLYLERKGAINFGCGMCHYNVERPRKFKTEET